MNPGMLKGLILQKARDEVETMRERLADICTYVSNNMGKDYGLIQLHTFMKVTVADMDQDLEILGPPK